VKTPTAVNENTDQIKTNVRIISSTQTSKDPARRLSQTFEVSPAWIKNKKPGIELRINSGFRIYNDEFIF
jgi:hypothetical protein